MGKKVLEYCTFITKSRVIYCLVLASVIVPGVLLSSCSQESRHKVLTFFFEGVPPPGSKRVSRFTRKVETQQSRVIAGNGKRIVLSSQKRGSSHEPSRDCNKCHSGRKGSNQGQLTQPVPGLCYTCHENLADRGGYVHGPRAFGECLFCHRPHQSSFVHLQVAAQPELCYRCHRREDMGTILDHEIMLETICTDCHEPHASTRKKLLKPFDEWTIDPNDLKIDEKAEEDPNDVKVNNLIVAYSTQ